MSNKPVVNTSSIIEGTVMLAIRKMKQLFNELIHLVMGSTANAFISPTKLCVSSDSLQFIQSQSAFLIDSAPHSYSFFFSTPEIPSSFRLSDLHF